MQDRHASHVQLSLHVLVLAQIAKVQGEQLLTKKAELFDLASSLLAAPSPSAHKYGTKLLKGLLMGWTRIYHKDTHHVSEKVLRNPGTIFFSYHVSGVEYQDHHFIYWGFRPDAHSAKIRWHVPSLAEVAASTELIERFLVSAMEVLEADIKSAVVNKAKIMRGLFLLRAMVKGASTYSFERKSDDQQTEDGKEWYCELQSFP